jgi:hypothetical protein
LRHRWVLPCARSWLFQFGKPVDDCAIGQAWDGEDLAGSPFAYMQRPSVILKADDFGSPLDSHAVRFLDLLSEIGACATLGIITSQLPLRGAHSAAYRRLHRAGFELYFHGRRHHVSSSVCEFRGRSAAAQSESLRRGLKEGRRRLGVTFRTFGAPGNAYDGNTATALLDHPQITNWLYGDSRARITVWPRLSDVESSVGVVMQAEEFIEGLPYIPLDKTLTLQVHPWLWSEESFARFERIQRWLNDRFAFWTPSDRQRWMQQAARVSIVKRSEAEYAVLVPERERVILMSDPRYRVERICRSQGEPRVGGEAAETAWKPAGQALCTARERLWQARR